MKKLILPVIFLAALMFACTVTTNPTQPPVTNPPVVVTELPVVTEPPVLAQTNLTCNEISLFLDPALASGYNCETIPESADGIEVYPQYTELTLQGYVLSGKFFEPHISVFAVARYTQLLPDYIPGRVSELQALTGGGAAGDSLPLLPSFNAAQIFHAQYRSFSFANGAGIRFLTEYAQYYAPVDNNDLFYTYQGLTSDGQYWVSAILPINNAQLPANADNPPNGMSWEQFGNNYDPYITDMVNQLNSWPSNSYSPTLDALDALVASINIQP